MAFRYKKYASGLNFADDAGAFLNKVVTPDLNNFAKKENRGLKPRIQDALNFIIEESLAANEYRAEDKQLRLRGFGQVRGKLKYLLYLLDMAVERHCISPDRAGVWQKAINDLMGMINGLIGAARR